MPVDVLSSVGTATALGLLAIGYSFRQLFTYRLDRQRLELEMRRTYLEVEAASMDVSSRRKDSNPDLELLRELLRRQGDTIDRLAARDTNVLVHVDPSGAPPPERSLGPERRQPDEQFALVVRELAHSLNTPLSQIEAAALVALNKNGVKDLDALSRIRTSVEVCKAFLSAYRELTEVTRSGSDWNPSSLRDLLSSAGEMYKIAHGRPDLTVALDVPPQFSSYPSSFLAAVTLPLIENAVEAATDKSSVRINGLQRAGELRLEVRNSCQFVPDHETVLTRGFTTKDGHDGLGLTVVQTLLSERHGSLSLSFTEGEVLFAAVLPIADDAS